MHTGRQAGRDAEPQTYYRALQCSRSRLNSKDSNCKLLADVCSYTGLPIQVCYYEKESNIEAWVVAKLCLGVPDDTETITGAPNRLLKAKAP